MAKRKQRGLADLMIENGFMFDACVSFVENDALREAAKCSFKKSPMANNEKGIFKDLLNDENHADEFNDLFTTIKVD